MLLAHRSTSLLRAWGYDVSTGTREYSVWLRTQEMCQDLCTARLRLSVLLIHSGSISIVSAHKSTLLPLTHQRAPTLRARDKSKSGEIMYDVAHDAWKCVFFVGVCEYFNTNGACEHLLLDARAGVGVIHQFWHVTIFFCNGALECLETVGTWDWRIRTCKMPECILQLTTARVDKEGWTVYLASKSQTQCACWREIDPAKSHLDVIWM